jgi:hypothetical protein
VVTYYGKDNPIDGVILDVLLRKHKAIKSDLGVAVAVPGTSEQVAEALFQGALFREKTRGSGKQLRLDFIDELDLGPKKHALHAEWESARERERATRSRFAQHTLSPEAVAVELASVREAIGRSEDVAVFLDRVLKAANVPLTMHGKAVKVSLSAEVPRALRQAIGRDDPFSGRFELPIDEGELYLGRTSPIVEGLAGWALDQALDRQARDARAVAARCGIISTSKVSTRTTLLVARFRYHLQIGGASGETLLCEEIVPLACTGSADAPVWLTKEEGEQLLTAKPERNLISTLIDQQVELVTASLPKLQDALATVAKERARAQLEAHERVREAARTRGKVTVAPVLPADILGAYVILPKAN